MLYNILCNVASIRRIFGHSIAMLKDRQTLTGYLIATLMARVPLLRWANRQMTKAILLPLAEAK